MQLSHLKGFRGTDIIVIKDRGGSRISGKGVRIYKSVCVCEGGGVLILSHFSLNIP